MLGVHDLSILRGYGVFDYLRTYNGLPFHLTDHLLRLQRSARLAGLELDISMEELENRVRQTLAVNKHQESGIRILVTGGSGEDNMMPSGSPKIIIMVTPLEKPSSCYRNGVKIITSQVERFLPRAKTINYIPAIMMLKEAQARQALEAVHTSRDGYLLEGTTSNFFAVSGGVIKTAAEDKILPGITRKLVIKLARKIAPLKIGSVHRDEIRLLDEAFLTASNKEIIPVVNIDEIRIGNGKPGKITGRIIKRFKKYTSRYCVAASS